MPNSSHMRWLRPSHYKRLTTDIDDTFEDQDHDAASLSSASLTILPEVRDSEDSNKQSRWSSTRILLAFSLLCLFLSLSFYIQKVRHHVTDEHCTRQMSAPSPALDAVRLEWVTFNEIFQPDKYSGYPTGKSEVAWGELWDFGAFSVPLESLAGLNKSSMDGDFRLVGDGGVGGLLEGAHQIHCLNLIRQYIYRDHWDYSHLPSFSGGEKTRRAHVDHCIETLRIVFSCQSDVAPYILHKSTFSGKVVGRSYPRKCRVYSELVKWVNTHAVFDTAEGE